MNLRVISCLAVASFAAAAFADHMPTHSQWRGIQVSTSEEFYALGRTPEKKYPIHWMFDGKPETAWVYESKSKLPPDVYLPFPGRISVSISIPKGMTVDGLRLMNGYNKSAALYQANSRIAGIEVSIRAEDGYKVIKRTGLKDQMGWRTVSLPRTKTEELFITVTKTLSGPLKDVCISELQLLYKGQPLNLKPTEIIVSSYGSECGCGSTTWFYDRGYGFRREVDREFVEHRVSPRGLRAVALFDTLVNREWVGTLRVFDGRRGRELSVPLPKGFQVNDAVWLSESHLKVTGALGKKESTRIIRF